MVLPRFLTSIPHIMCGEDRDAQNDNCRIDASRAALCLNEAVRQTDECCSRSPLQLAYASGCGEDFEKNVDGFDGDSAILPNRTARGSERVGQDECQFLEVFDGLQGPDQLAGLLEVNRPLIFRRALPLAAANESSALFNVDLQNWTWSAFRDLFGKLQVEAS